jgi:hypothetical protein
MGVFARLREWRNAVSLAIRLRRFAAGTFAGPDQALYLLAAEALEKRREELAVKSQSRRIPPGDPKLYRSVDMTV